MKKFFRNIHLYLSLVTGLVIAVVCFTGAVLVFEKEMQMSLYPERYRVTPGAARVPLEQLIAGVRKTVPGAKVTSVKVYDDPSRSVEVSYGEGKGNNNQAFMNPYTGELISLYSYRTTFFFTMFSLHRWLLADDVGKMIVGISTIAFLFILGTGIVLWWPKNKAILKNRLRLKWSAGWKRLNHDLHIVIGFYTAIFLFAFAFTGLAWSFEWFNDGIYWVTGSNKKPAKPPVSVVREGAGEISMDQAYAAAKEAMPEAEYYTINRAREPEDAVRVVAMGKDAAHERASDQIFIDQYAGTVLGVRHFGDQSLGQRVRSTFYPIHVGSIGGLPGRIVAFISCVAGFTFPITGVILWINRLKKKKRGSSVPVSVRRDISGAVAHRQEAEKKELVP